MKEETLHDRMTNRYASRETPWDSELPPPEVIDFVHEQIVPGRALDIGCGYGRASIYMAKNGWVVDGLDFVEQAVAEAQKRAKAAAVQDKITFHHADITDLSFLKEPYDLAVDVGCAHALDQEQWKRHHRELRRLLQPGATYLLYGRVLDRHEENPRGFDEPVILDLLTDGFTLHHAEHGLTEMDDGTSWRSVWYWWQRDES